MSPLHTLAARLGCPAQVDHVAAALVQRHEPPPPDLPPDLRAELDLAADIAAEHTDACFYWEGRHP